MTRWQYWLGWVVVWVMTVPPILHALYRIVRALERGR